MMGILRAFGFSSEVEGESEAQAKAAARKQAEQCTILAIDDDNEFLQLVRTALKDEGYNVLTSTSGPKGLDMIRYAPSPVRVVLLDYDMPKLNGAETMAFMRRLSPHTKIVAVTGMDETFLPADFRQGVDHTIFKPFQMEQLLGLINRMVTTYPALAAQSAH